MVESPNGLKYDYTESFKDETGKRNTYHGTLFLESDRLIGKNYELIQTNNGESTIFIYDQGNDIELLNDEEGEKKKKKTNILSGFIKYDCRGGCECEYEKEGIENSKFRIYKTMIEKKGKDPMIQLKETMNQECKMATVKDELHNEVDDGYKCHYIEDEGVCTERKKESFEYGCTANCIYPYGEESRHVTVPNDGIGAIMVEAQTGIEAVKIAESIYFPEICEEDAPEDLKGKSFIILSCCTVVFDLPHGPKNKYGECDI